MIADQYLETQLWELLWSRISQSLKLEQEQNNENLGNNNIESLNQANQLPSSSQNPFDWTFLSPNGYFYLLQLASRMLTMSTQNCIALILKDDCIMFDTLSYILSDRFLNSIKQT